MKPVGKPDAGNPHVRFDERGRETGRLAKPLATAPFLDSTVNEVLSGRCLKNCLCGRDIRLQNCRMTALLRKKQTAETDDGPPETHDIARVREILAAVRPLAAEYYRLTGKPLGVTGEVAEFVAAEHLGLQLAVARTAGYDAVRYGPEGPIHIQIKGRAYGDGAKPGQRLGRIKTDARCDVVLLVLLDNATLEPREMWEAPFSEIIARLAEPGSKARNERGALSVYDFKRLKGARLVWPRSEASVRL
jgi:uncharacterized protein DUF6998